MFPSDLPVYTRVGKEILHMITSRIKEAIANVSNAGWPSNSGLPFSVPLGTVLDVAKETPAMSAATTEHDSDVSFNHSELFFTRSLCFSLNISPAVLSSLLFLNIKCSGTSSLMYCAMVESKDQYICTHTLCVISNLSID